MRSMRASRSEAAASGWTVNGSMGARRKRDFVFMRGYSATEYAEDRSKRVAEAAEDRGAIAGGDRIVRPRGAAGDREREVVDQHEVRGELAANRAADVRQAERRIPGVAEVDERRGVQRSHEDRPNARTTLHAQERHAQVRVQHGRIAPDDVVAIEAAHEADRIAPEVERRRRGPGACRGETPLARGVTPARHTREPDGENRVAA